MNKSKGQRAIYMFRDGNFRKGETAQMWTAPKIISLSNINSIDSDRSILFSSLSLNITFIQPQTRFFKWEKFPSHLSPMTVRSLNTRLLVER